MKRFKAAILLLCLTACAVLAEDPPPFKAFFWGAYLGTGKMEAAVKVTEAAPELQVWFGDRTYQKELAEKGEEFIVSSQPRIRIESRITHPYSLSPKDEDYRIVIDEGTASMRSYSMKDLDKSQTKVSGEMALPAKLNPGKHNFVISAKSAGALGEPAETKVAAKVTVLGGPLRIVDSPLVFPSPFNPEKDRRAAIQYTLSDDADVDIFIFNMAAQIVKKIPIVKGQEGGTAQLNKVFWDGIEDMGAVASSGIYIGNIVARQEKKVLGKFKLTIYR